MDLHKKVQMEFLREHGVGGAKCIRSGANGGVLALLEVMVQIENITL